LFEIQVSNDISFTPDIDRINDLVNAAFSALGLDSNSVSFGIFFTTDEEIQALNAQYRGFDKPTDVLSFDANMFDPEQSVTYLGDVILAVPTMEHQAILADHPVETEMLLLITHGFLHLNGYDHATDKEKIAMWKQQGEILSAIGVIPRKITED
jgi:probable rRNA maturation factor